MLRNKNHLPKPCANCCCENICVDIGRKQLSHSDPLEQWFSTFLMLRPFNTVPHVVVTPNHEVISLLLYNYDFATVMNHNVEI